MPTLMVLAAGPLQLPAVTTAKRMGLRVVAADGNPASPGLALADVGSVINILDAEECLALARREKVDGVVHICSEVSMYAMGRINEELGLHGIDSATAVRCTNKQEMRRAFEAAGAPSPRSTGVTTAEEAVAAAAIGRPAIVKPARNSGSRGVTRLAEGDGPEAVVAAFEYAMAESRDPMALVEEYVTGPEFSVEILAWAGRCSDACSMCWDDRLMGKARLRLTSTILSIVPLPALMSSPQPPKSLRRASKSLT